MDDMSTQRPWTPKQLDLLMRSAAVPSPDWSGISLACGHSAGSCRVTLNNLLRRIAEDNAVAFGKGNPLNPKRTWSREEIAELVRLRTVEGLAFPAIDLILGRAIGASVQKFHTRRPDPPAGVRFVTRAIHAPKFVPEHESLTAAFFGDPLPGRSALDKKGPAAPAAESP